MRVISNILIGLFFTGLITGGFYCVLLSTFPSFLTAIGLWGFSGLMFKINIVCDHYLKVNNLK